VLRRTRLLNLLGLGLAAAIALLAVRHFAARGWPIHRADPWLVGAAIALSLLSYAVKAWAWQLLFRRDHRPAVLTLAAAGGAASIGGIALPGRCDDLVRVAVVRRCRRGPASIGAIVLSLFLLGLLDSVALTPLASVAAGVSHARGLLLATLVVVAAAGIGSAGVILLLPRLVAVRRLDRFRFTRTLGEHLTPTREAARASVGVATSWALRSVAVFVLLAALGMRADFALALAFVCASSASAVLPIAPAGAAMQAGAGAAVLASAGIHAEQAVAFGIAAQALSIVAGATFVLALGLWHAQARLTAGVVPARLRLRRA
jgi:Lysylphosphatidylglycerol synthase TM region